MGCLLHGCLVRTQSVDVREYPEGARRPLSRLLCAARLCALYCGGPADELLAACIALVELDQRANDDPTLVEHPPHAAKRSALTRCAIDVAWGESPESRPACVSHTHTTIVQRGIVVALCPEMHTDMRGDDSTQKA